MISNRSNIIGCHESFLYGKGSWQPIFIIESIFLTKNGLLVSFASVTYVNQTHIKINLLFLFLYFSLKYKLYML